jgi:hypothetical protein
MAGRRSWLLMWLSVCGRRCARAALGFGRGALLSLSPPPLLLPLAAAKAPPQSHHHHHHHQHYLAHILINIINISFL